MQLLIIFLITLAATYGSWYYLVNISAIEHIRNLKIASKFAVMSIVTVAVLSFIYMVF